MKLFIYQATPARASAFVEYWSSVYPRENDCELYTPNIGRRSPEAIHNLFLWKFGKRFAKSTRLAVEKEVISRLDELNALPENISADDFLRQRFSKGGAIFRIFLLHCFSPNRFPIYDQHVHRAMAVIKSGKCEEIEAWSDKEKITSYLQDYLPFQREFAGLDQRPVDQALWAFGKFIKTSRLPGQS